MEETPILTKTFSQKTKGFYIVFISLIISNFISVVLAFFYGFDLVNFLWIYWFQSIAVGFITVFELLSLKRFSTEGIKPDLPANKTSSKYQVASIFIFAYGIFHLAYAIFLNVFFTLFIIEPGINWTMILTGSFAFFAHYIIEFYTFKKNNATEKIPNLTKIIIKPFYRIVPMHLTIIIAVWIILMDYSSKNQNISLIILIIFITIKTIIDLSLQFYIYKKQ